MIHTVVGNSSCLFDSAIFFMKAIIKLWFIFLKPTMMASSKWKHFPVTGESLSQRPVTRSFDVFFVLRQNKRLSKQSWGRWCETPSCHYDVTVMNETSIYGWMVILCDVPIGAHLDVRYNSEYTRTMPLSISLSAFLCKRTFDLRLSLKFNLTHSLEFLIKLNALVYILSSC